MQFSLLALTGLLASALAAPALNARTDAPTKPAPAGWTIKNFVRNCTDPNICTYYIYIDLGDGKDPHKCTITDKATPATNHPFYAVGCDEGLDFKISWGWDYVGDFTVLTVVQVVTGLEAFFGYNHPNAPFSATPPQPVVSYKDVGPNAVQHV